MVGLGDPVFGKDFFNREPELELLNRRLNSFLNEGQTRNIAIIGLRKIGKSSLIKEFIKRNTNRTNCLFVPIYLPESGGRDLIFRCMSAIVVNSLKIKKETIKPDSTLRTAINSMSKYYPNSAIAITHIIDELTQNISNLRNVLSLFSIFQKESKLSVVIIMDEFQRLDDYYEFDSAIDTFREFAMETKKIWFIISGSSIGMLNKITASSESPLFGHFEILFLKEFDFNNAKKLVTKKLAPFSMPQLNLTFLYDITNGNPYYLDILSFRIKDILYAEGKQVLSDSLLIRALTFEMFSAGGAIHSHLSSLLEMSFEKRGFGNYIDIVKSIAKGCYRPSEISKESNIPLSSLPRYLNKLIDLDIVGKKEPTKERSLKYYFIDSLFEFWLREAYILREDSIVTDLGIKKREFENRIEKILGEFKSEIGKGNEARIRELFGCLDGNDKIHGVLLPQFTLVQPFNKAGEEIDIFAKTKEGEIWLAGIKDTDISITDIKDFIKKCARNGFESNRKIFIALAGIEQKTDRFCKNMKILLLTKDDINSLLKRYNKKRILH